MNLQVKTENIKKLIDSIKEGFNSSVICKISVDEFLNTLNITREAALYKPDIVDEIRDSKLFAWDKITFIVKNEEVIFFKYEYKI